MGCGIIAFRDENVIMDSALQRLIQGNRRTHEMFLDLAESFKTRFELEMMVGRFFGNGGYDGNKISLGTDIVGRRHNGNIDICK